MMHDPHTERLSAYLDGALSPSEKADVESLLARDAGARKVLDALKILRAAVKDLPPAAPSEAFYARVWRDIDAAPRRNFWSYAPFKAAGALAATALVVVATHDIWRSPAIRQAKLAELAKEAPSPIQMFQSSLKAQQASREAPASSVDEDRRSLAFDEAAPAPSAPPQAKEDDAMLGNEVTMGGSSSHEAPALGHRQQRAEQSQELKDLSKARGAAGALSPTMERERGGMNAADALISGAKKKSANAPLAVGGAMPARSDGPAEKNEVVFLQEWRGTDSGVTGLDTVVVRSPSEWTALWARHAPGTRAPAVDFSRLMVVGVFAGEKSTGGHAVTVLNAYPARSHFRVSYHIAAPPDGAFVTQALTSPFHLVLVPLSYLPVRFDAQ